MQKIALILCCFLVFSSCKSKKTAQSSSRKSQHAISNSQGQSYNDTYNDKVNAIIDYAETFESLEYDGDEENEEPENEENKDLPYMIW